MSLKIIHRHFAQRNGRWLLDLAAGAPRRGLSTQDPHDGANPSSQEAFRAAHHFLIKYRSNYKAAKEGFVWPSMNTFNFALDWFDAELARGNRAHQTALKIVGEHPCSISFKELSEQSNRIANAFIALGVQPGDRILVMLGNVAALWTVMLAAMKVRAVASPTTPLLTPTELAERIERGNIRHVIAASEEVGKFSFLAPSMTRVSVGPTMVAGWVDYSTLLHASPVFSPASPTKCSDPLLLYFTSGTTAKPKMVLHSHASYPLGHLTTAYWLGLLPGDIHLNISSPGWAKHAYSWYAVLQCSLCLSQIF